MKLGTMLRVPDIDGAEDVFALLNRMGYPSGQLVYKPEEYTREDANKMLELSEKYGVELNSQFAGFRPGMPTDSYSKMDYWKRAAEFISWLGLTDMVVHAGDIPTDKKSFQYAYMCEKIRYIAEYIKGFGLNLLFETGIELPVMLLGIIENDVATGNLYVNLDTANSITSGWGNPVDALAVFGKYVRNVHIKDGLPPTSALKRGPEVAVGEGWVDFPAVIAALKKLNYDRYLTVEREISGEQQQKDLIRTRAYIETLWNRA